MSMVYIAYAVSGPLKRVFIEALKHGYLKYYGFDEPQFKRRINIKGVVRQSGQQEKYDDFELKFYNSTESLLNEYEKDYTYLNDGEHFAVNKKQIEESIADGNDHFVICNDSNVIKKIVADFAPNVKLLHFSLRNYYITLNKLCELYNDNYNERLQKIVEFDKRLEESGIQYDVDIKIENNEQDDLLELKIWEALNPRINNKYFCWRNLLSTDAENSTTEQTDDMRFERDYENTIYSSAHRRLQDKTQVFPLEKYDYIRTRLTHSNECATIAKRLGLKAIDVIKKHPESGFIELCNKIPTLLETAALLHDMGNPPFGHFGESIIRDWFRSNLGKSFGYESSLRVMLGQDSEQINDLLNFEGNAQLLRLASKLSMANGYFEGGLNLTYATLATVIKYPTNSSKIDVNVLSKKKLGYYSTEAELFNSIQNRVRLNGHRHPLSFLLEAADDISYLTSDIQDAHKKRLIQFSQLKQGIYELCESLNGEAKGKFKAIHDIFENIFKQSEHSFSEDVSLEFVCSNIRKILIDESIMAFDQHYSEIMEGEFETELLQCLSFSKNMVSYLSGLLKKFVYDEPNIIESEISASKILGTLLDTFIPAVLAFNSNHEISSLQSRLHLLLSENYKYVCMMCNRKIDENTKLSKNEKDIRKTFNRVMLATDFICGMTDSYAKTIYNKICAF